MSAISQENVRRFLKTNLFSDQGPHILPPFSHIDFGSNLFPLMSQSPPHFLIHFQRAFVLHFACFICYRSYLSFGSKNRSGLALIS